MEESIDHSRSPDKKPENIRELTIRNLDTGEEFVIGENDPDFEFDTFEITCRPLEPGEQEEDDEGHDGEANTIEEPALGTADAV